LESQLNVMAENHARQAMSPIVLGANRKFAINPQR